MINFTTQNLVHNLVTKQTIYKQVPVAVLVPNVIHNNPQTDRHTVKESK